MDPEIAQIIDRLKEGMIDFMSDGEASYKEEHVDKCIAIITVYLRDMDSSQSKEQGMQVVEKAVITLNRLNEHCDYELIETDQREDLCEIIILAGNAKGYNELTDDITEEWREW